MAYSKDLRQKALNYLEAGHSAEEVSQVFGVALRTVFNWLKRQRNGCLEDKPRKRYPIKIDNDQLKNYIKKHPDSYLKEIAKEFNVDPSSIFYACKRLKITLKKRPYFTKKEMRKNVRSLKKN
ncbi:IS630 transposase-related protein [Candidatus Protochlamydia amoebophila]|uniref:IS630 transposase-related protein n=1 Tax=Candidatus Protochlamydia amoebophila TaxID=362787 RepID=UPI001BC95437|nr:IS630 transposase-related protein [Candidatus Protochlamydia amoebophila]